MQNLSAVASEYYLSFLITMKEEGTIGYLLPRSDVAVFIENARKLVDTKESFPEVGFTVGCMFIEIMAAGLSVMFQCTNTKNDKKLQFAIESDVCIALLNRMEGAEKTATQMYGPPEVMTTPWKFYNYLPAA